MRQLQRKAIEWECMWPDREKSDSACVWVDREAIVGVAADRDRDANLDAMHCIPL